MGLVALSIRLNGLLFFSFRKLLTDEDCPVE